MSSLVANYNSSSSSDDDSDDSSVRSASGDDEKGLTNQKFKLPSLHIESLNQASSSISQQHRKLDDHSVYSNPYAKQQEVSLSILSKHKQLSDEVKTTNASEKRKNMQEKKKKSMKEKLCMNFFKKGNCKYGSDCKFLHSVASTQNITITTGNTVDVTKEPCKYTKKSHRTSALHAGHEETIGSTDDALWEGGIVTEQRKRPGLSDTIVPSKKVLKIYQNQNKSGF